MNFIHYQESFSILNIFGENVLKTNSISHELTHNYIRKRSWSAANSPNGVRNGSL